MCRSIFTCDAAAMAAQHGRDVLWSAARSQQITLHFTTASWHAKQFHNLPLNGLPLRVNCKKLGRICVCLQKDPGRGQRFSVGVDAKGAVPPTSHLCRDPAPTRTTRHSGCRKQDSPTTWRQDAQRHHWESRVCLPSCSVAGVRRKSMSAEGGWIGDTTWAV